jgi:hypothetical protein
MHECPRTYAMGARKPSSGATHFASGGSWPAFLSRSVLLEMGAAGGPEACPPTSATAVGRWGVWVATEAAVEFEALVGLLAAVVAAAAGGGGGERATAWTLVHRAKQAAARSAEVFGSLILL